MTIIVDAHQHFWNYGTYQSSWMEAPPYAGDPVYQHSDARFTLTIDLLPELKAAGVDYTITVEAADGKAENEALLANARVHAWIAGVVGWLPLDLPVAFLIQSDL
jgi:predicted TIM-barrel fold metal-dependent hydrolase